MTVCGTGALDQAWFRFLTFHDLRFLDPDRFLIRIKKTET